MILKYSLRTALLASLGVAVLLQAAPAQAQAQTGELQLKGIRGQNCTIEITHTGAQTLDMTTGAHTNVPVGTVTQNCNKKVGYDLNITSQTCVAQTPDRAALGGGAPLADREFVSYSVNFINPVEASTTGLLASDCTDPALQVRSRKVTAEESTVQISYTVPADLSADTYTDVLTIEMVVQ